MIARPELRELHVVLDHRVRADHQRRLARWRPRSSICVARLALAAAGEPGHAATPQRLEPAAPACGSAARPGSRWAPSARTASRRRWRRAAASAATTVLPEPTSPCSRRCIGMRARQVARRSPRRRAAARAVSAKGSAASSCSCRPAGVAAQRRRAQRRAFALRLQLRQLLRQQFLELQPLPGRVAAVLQRRPARTSGARVVQERAAPRAATAGPGGSDARRQHLVERRARQRRGDRLAQVGLRQLRAGRDTPASAPRPAACRRRPP